MFCVIWYIYVLGFFLFAEFVEGSMFSKLLCVYIYMMNSTCLVEIKIKSVLWFGLMNVLFDLIVNCKTNAVSG